MADEFDRVLYLLPEYLRSCCRRLPAKQQDEAEEIRLRAGGFAAIVLPEGERVICNQRRLRQSELMGVLETASGCSMHSAVHELEHGYVSARGGLRVGVCGTAVWDGRIRGIRDFSSLSIRIPRQIKSAGEQAAEELISAGGSVLIISNPGGGKTTFLRELIRRSSEKGTRVSVADERGEIAAVWEGVPQFDVGPCTDVMSGAPKAKAAMLLLRAMNPGVIAFDEITEPEDVQAISGVCHCGVRVYATAHAGSLEQLRSRSVYSAALDSGCFDRAVLIQGRGSQRRYRVVHL